MAVGAGVGGSWWLYSVLGGYLSAGQLLVNSKHGCRAVEDFYSLPHGRPTITGQIL